MTSVYLHGSIARGELAIKLLFILNVQMYQFLIVAVRAMHILRINISQCIVIQPLKWLRNDGCIIAACMMFLKLICILLKNVLCLLLVSAIVTFYCI